MRDKTATHRDVELVHPRALSPDDIAAWRRIQADEPAFANPLLGPDFARLVGRVRTDVRVAVYRRQGQAVAFLAHHRRPGGFGRPIGAPFSDYQGLVARAAEGLSGRTALRLAGLKAFRFNGLIDPHGAFDTVQDAVDAYAIDIPAGAEAHLEAMRAASPKKFKNWRRLQNRLAEVGPLSLRADHSQAAFDQMMTWKREQFVRTGVQDVLRPDWVQALMQSIFDVRKGPTQGLMLSLYAGDTLVAAHFGLIGNGIYHPWIASTHPDYAAVSPGQAFLDQAIRAMPGLGISTYDLGTGTDHYKRPFCSQFKTVASGLALTETTPSRRSVPIVLPTLSGRAGSALDKVRRRLDHIASMDPTVGGRFQGLVEAAMASRTRGFGGGDLRAEN